MAGPVSRRALGRGILAGTAASLLGASAARAAPRELVWWHAMSGVVRDRLEELTSQYNASQGEYAVVPVFKGTYDELINATVAAYRTRTNPQLVQVYERGFMTMLLSNAVVPVQELMAAQKVPIDWTDFIKPIAGYYTYKGQLASMPFNSSTPILFYNKAHFAKAGYSAPAETWQGLEAQLRAVKAAGGPGSILAEDYHWSWFENYSAIHDVPYATRANGFGGLDTEFVYNRSPLLVGQLGRMKRWLDGGLMEIAGQGVAAVSVFTSGRSATFMASTAGHAAVMAATGLDWGATLLPVEEGTTPRNSVIGGATLWVLKGHSDVDYAGVASFLAFLAKPETQVWWHKATGYVPATNAAYALAKQQGWYQQRPTQELAVLQLTRGGTPTENSVGFRFGNFTQAMLAQREEAERAFAGQKPPQQAFDDAVARGNDILRRFERLNAGRY